LFIRSFLVILLVSSCSNLSIKSDNVSFDASFSSEEKFLFKKCLINKDSVIELTNLTFEGFAENINDRGLEFNTKYTLKVSAKDDDAKPRMLMSMQMNTNNYISSNMADSERKRIKSILIEKVCMLF
tara:strand:- start:967 stop:1347 length:381 start_codon:yes stop_codon:yes gene_type:complete